MVKQKGHSIGHSNRVYFYCVFVFLLLSTGFLMLTSRASGFRLLTLHHPFILNIFFTYYTNLGDGLFSLFIVMVLLFFRKYELAIQILLAFLISGLFAQVLKGLISSPRPRDFFAGGDPIYYVQGETLSGNASFPSGHSASAFALATSLALYARNKWIGIIYLLLAILVGYSRVYLSQHFPGDVYAGAVVGVLTAVGICLLMNKYYAKLAGRVARKKESRNP